MCSTIVRDRAVALGLAMLAFGMHVGFVAPAIPKALASHVAANRLARANGVALVGYDRGVAGQRGRGELRGAVDFGSHRGCVAR